MTFLVSLLFVTAIVLSLLTMTASFKSSWAHILDIVEDRNMPVTASPNIRIGDIKHYKIALNTQETNKTDDIVIALPLNLTNLADASDAEWQKAA